MDLLESGFRPRYEEISVGNKPANAQYVFFEGLLLKEGLGTYHTTLFCKYAWLSNDTGQDQPWSSNSAWGHPDFNRRSVSLRIAQYCARCTDMVQAHRKALLDIMTSYIPIRSVKFNKRLVGIDQHSNGVILRFADGEVAKASVLVGADGIKSVVREHVLRPLDPSQVDPVYADAYCYRGVIPMSEAKEILGSLTDVARFYFGHRRCAVTYRISGGKVS
jgi:salicylate hydroxylase